MDLTFGSMLLAVNQVIDGKTLAYGYCNRQMPEKVRTLQIEFQLRFSRWITAMNGFMDGVGSITDRGQHDLDFLKLCVENLENISEEKLDWYTPSI